MNEDEVIENEDKSADEAPDTAAPRDMKHLDFITSLVIMALSVFVVISAHGFYVKSRKAFYASPGFMPAIIAGALFLLALYLMVQSLNKSSVKECCIRLVEALPRGLKSVRFKNTIIGLALFAVYVYILLRFLPFWLASTILLFACFVYLKAAKLVKSAVIAVLSAAGIVLLFQIVFRVPMP
jgi:hypothetical protein